MEPWPGRRARVLECGSPLPHSPRTTAASKAPEDWRLFACDAQAGSPKAPAPSPHRVDCIPAAKPSRQGQGPGMIPCRFRPERPRQASPGPGAAPPWVRHSQMGISPSRATQPSAPPSAIPSLCRPFRAGILSAGSPRALPWAGLLRPVGASLGAPAPTGYHGFTVKGLEQKATKETEALSGRTPSLSLFPSVRPP